MLVKRISWTALIVLIAALSACGTPQSDGGAKQGASPAAQDQPTPLAAEKKSYVVAPTIPAPSMNGNLLGEKPEKELVVCLPPSYYDSDKRYPVVYVLDGYLGSPNTVIRLKYLADEVFQKGGPELILVAVDGSNRFQGNFYTNSKGTGNMEDHVTREAVNYVDAQFRTIPKPSARGMLGFSMGGSGVLNIGLKHPDLYSALYAVSPGAFDENGLVKAFKSWDNSFKQAYGVAFSPNASLPAPYAEIPQFNGTPEDQAIISRWESGYGQWPEKIKAYADGSTKLKAIRLEYGIKDQYTWIPEGTRYMSALLDQYQIHHELKEVDAKHDFEALMVKRFKEQILPFFQTNLKPE